MLIKHSSTTCNLQAFCVELHPTSLSTLTLDPSACHIISFLALFDTNATYIISGANKHPWDYILCQVDIQLEQTIKLLLRVIQL